MQALVCKSYGDVNNLLLDDVPIPKPQKGEVLVKINACGINFPDLLIVKGMYQFKPKLPFSPGAEISGVVVETGDEVYKIKTGDHVAGGIGWGGMAEYVICKEKLLTKHENTVACEVLAASMVTYGTAYHALIDRAEIRQNETVLIMGGSGGVSVASIQLAKLYNCTVICVCSSQAKADFCKKLGVDVVIDYHGIKEKVKKIAPSGKADIVVDPVGGPLASEAIRTLQWKGRYLVIGFSGGEISKLPLNLVLLKGVDVKGVFWSQLKELENNIYQTNQQQIINWIQEGIVVPPPAKKVSLSDVKEILKMYESRSVIGKYVVSMR